MKAGSFNSLPKPFQRAQLIRVIRKALEHRELVQENRALQRRLDDLLREGHIIGASPAFRRMMRSEEHTSELQSQSNLVCRLLLEKKKNSSPGGRSRSSAARPSSVPRTVARYL